MISVRNVYVSARLAGGMLAELGGEPAPGSVQPDARGIPRAAEHGGDLTGIEPFPAGQREQFPVGLRHPAECGDSPVQVAGEVWRAVTGGEVSSEPVGER